MILLLIATALEAGGDAVIRIGLYNHVGALRAALYVAGTALLFGYGLFLNLGPLEFGRVVGLYISTLFVMFQLINYLVFHTVPTLSIVLGGALIIAGGLIVAFWKPA